MIISLKVLICTLVFLVVAESVSLNLQEQNGTDINPLIDYDDTNKEHNKRTIFHNKFNNIGWAKHVKLQGGKRVVLGYTAVDLKYVPVAKPLSLRPMNNNAGWRFKQKRKPIRPLMTLWPARPIMKPAFQGDDGWKPIIPAHVPAPPSVESMPWQEEGWSKPDITHLNPVPGVQQPVQTTVLKPSKPLYVYPNYPHIDHVHVDQGHIDIANQGQHIDHVHHGQQIDHLDHGQHIDHVLHGQHIDHMHHGQYIDPVLHGQHIDHVHHGQHIDHVQLIHDQAHDGHHHHDYLHHQHIDPIVPHSHIHYNPLLQVQKPVLPVLPLGATFPSQVLQNIPRSIIHQQPHVNPIIPQIPHYHVHEVVQDVPNVQSFISSYPHIAEIPHFAQHNPHVHSIPVGYPTIPDVHKVIPQHIDGVSLGYPHIHANPNVQFAHIPQNHQPDIIHTHLSPIPNIQQDFVNLHSVPTANQEQPPLNPGWLRVPQKPIGTAAVVPGGTLEYHGKHAQFIQAPQYAEQQFENYNPNILPGNAGHPQDIHNFIHSPHQPHVHNIANPEDPINDPNHTYQHPEEAPNALHPGYTDLQIPLHLPQHPNFIAHDQYDENFIKPSSGLEPPLK